MGNNKRGLVVYSDTGLVQSKQYCREDEVGGHIRDLLGMCTDTIKIVIKLDGK
ncbi:MAG: hypothetical protein KGH66_04055 [Candidatus Micrarchaeota archaeon]|nr:hypothetical protein [Candidatus Micrarchaeota archaeon]